MDPLKYKDVMTERSILLSVQQILGGASLSAEEAQYFFEAVVKGQVDDVLLAAAVSGIKVRRQTRDELVGASKALLASATPFPIPEYPFADVVGTGGDGHNTINISTIAAITAASCGAKIIKHGNRSISSVSGSFDLLSKLGIDLESSPKRLREQVDEKGICFLYAPNFHAGMRHAAAVRRSLKVRTIFNLLGPLVNPARPPKILLGVADPDLLQPIAEVLDRLGCQRAFVVHGSGLDEVAVHGSTTVIELCEHRLEQFELSPVDFGADRYPLDALVCGDADECHRRCIAVLEGNGSPAGNSAVGVNAALVLKLFGNDDLRLNFQQTQEALSAGKPMQLIHQLTGGDS